MQCIRCYYITSIKVSNNIKNLILFSDGPSSQNQNHTVVKFLLHLCDTQTFDTVTHYIPVRGHSFLPCDRDFGSIKRIIRRVDRVYTAEQYSEMILEASITGRISGHCVASKDEISNLKSWWPNFYKKFLSRTKHVEEISLKTRKSSSKCLATDNSSTTNLCKGTFVSDSILMDF